MTHVTFLVLSNHLLHSVNNRKCVCTAKSISLHNLDLKISCFGHFVSMCFVLVHIYFEIYKTSLVNQYKTH